MTKHPTEFDKFKENYSQEISSAISFIGQDHDFFNDIKVRTLLRILKDEKLTPTNVLDVGCGHGLIHEKLMRNLNSPLQLTGIDVASEVLEFAKAKNKNVSYDSYNGQHLPYPDGSFDFVFTICVLHHIPPKERERFVSEMVRVTRPGGIVVALEHNPLNPVVQYVVKTCKYDENAILLSKKELKGLFANTSLISPRTKYIVFTPFQNRFFQWLERILHWLPIGGQFLIYGRKSQ